MIQYRKFNDLSGQLFGKLKVISRNYETTDSRLLFNCICNCGKNVIVRSEFLKNGKVKSCGFSPCRLPSCGNRKHNKSNSTEYTTWMNIRLRCYNPKNSSYPGYGGRGITVCDEWKNSFESFYNDMGNKPNKHYSIERLDNSKGYSKENCIWTTAKIQANNTRNNVIIKINNIDKTLSEWSDYLNIKYCVNNNKIIKLMHNQIFENIMVGYSDWKREKQGFL